MMNSRACSTCKCMYICVGRERAVTSHHASNARRSSRERKRCELRWTAGIFVRAVATTVYCGRVKHSTSSSTRQAFAPQRARAFPSRTPAPRHARTTYDAHAPPETRTHFKNALLPARSRRRPACRVHGVHGVQDN